MRRLALYLGGGLVALVLLCLLGLFWLFNTAGGARLALSTLAGAAGYQLSVRDIEGRLADRLKLSGVRVSQPKLKARIDSLILVWEPRRLLHRNLMVRELNLSGVRIQDDRPPAEPAEPKKLSWPRVSELVRSFSASVSRLMLKDVSYRRLQEPPVLVSELSSSLGFKQGVVSVSGMSLVTPELRAAGEITAGFWHPSLRLDVTVVPAQPVQEFDLFSLQARLLPGRDPEQLSGAIAVAGRSGGAQRLELTAQLGMTQQAFNVRRLMISRPGRPGVVTGQGSVTLNEEQPLYSLALKVSDLNLEKELDLPTSISGTVRFSGTLSDFQGHFALKNSGPQWQSASLAADFRGGGSKLTMAPVTGKVLEGRLAGALEFAWEKGLAVSGNLAGRGLQPGQIAREWSGLVNLDLAGEYEKPEQGEPRGNLRGKLLESRLQGRELQGELVAAFEGERLDVERLYLAGRGFRLQGEGELDRRLNLAAKVSDLSGLVPGATGKLQADGWVRWRDGLFSGEASGRGSNLDAAGMSAKAFRFDARLGEEEGYPVHLDASVSRLRVGRVQVEDALLSLQGTAARHTLKAELNASGSETHLVLAGGYGNGAWSGELTRLYGRDDVAPWSLASPAVVTLSAERLDVAPIVINGLPGERVEIAADLNLEPLTGTVRGAWTGLILARANAWIYGAEVAGGSSGELRLRLLPGEQLVISGRAEAQGTLVAEGRRVNLERLAATLEGDQGGLRAELDLRLQGGAGEAHLLFRSPGPAALSLPERGDLRLNWSKLDLALLSPFIPPELAVTGRSAGVVTGRLLPGARLDLNGNASLDQGSVYWHAEGNQLDASIDTAAVNFDWRGELPGAGRDGAGKLKLQARAAATGAFTAKGERIAFGRVNLRAEANDSGTRATLNLALGEGGTLKLAVSSGSPVGPDLLEAADLALEWRGIDLALLKPWLPESTNLIIKGRSAGLVTGKLLPGGRLDLKGSADLDEGELNWSAEGEEIDASLDTAQVEFSWLGELPGAGQEGAGRLQLTARAAANGVYTANGERIALGRITLSADADRSGTRAELDLDLDGGGSLKAVVSSESPAGPGIPETGNLALDWSGIKPALLKPWLPGALELQGELAGQARGKLLPDQRLEMTGQAEFSQGRAKWQGDSGEMSANLRSASLSFSWRGETLSGALSLALAEYGRAQGSFQLPIPARLPVVPDPNGAVTGTLAGRVQERGFLTAFLPGLVQESHGNLDLDLRVGGIWSDPRLGGSVQLSNAGAYLPTAGIRVSEVQLLARLEGDQVTVEKLRAVSGGGYIEGNMTIGLDGWRVMEYSGSLSGERFQTVYLPELQMWTSPRLTFLGGSEQLTLRGELRIPEMLVSGAPVSEMVTASEDVILEGAPAAPEGEAFPLALDGRVRVVLGDKVEVKASGIDARLGGSMYLVIEGVDKISSSGEIRVVEGRYRAYGMDLEIVRGRLYYVDDPVDRPTLDILALRRVGEVRAGVTVAGSLDNPIVKLYSEPSMPEVDILAYMVLGHPLGASSEQGSMMALAATSLLSLGESTAVHEQIKDRLGLSVLGIQTVDTSGAGLMGYREVPVTPTGEAPARPAAAESLLTVGKYLTPEIFLSYGRSLITGGNLFMLRYDISRYWQLELQSGSESGADIYYKVEFD